MKDKLKDRVLGELLFRGTISGGEIASSFGVSRTAIWKAIYSLRTEGYAILGDRQNGYSLRGEGRFADKVSFLNTFRGSGRNVFYYEETGSTNTDLRALAEQGAPTGTLLVAERQSGGRGRLGRSFASPNGGLYMSLLLRPTLPISEVAGITSVAAVVAAQTLEEMTDLTIGIKWVNDLFVNGRKIAGILCEASLNLESGLADYVVVGIGLNLNGIIPSELSSIATTVAEEGGKIPDKGTFAKTFAERLEKMILNPYSPDIICESRRRSTLIGKDVNVIRGGTENPATVLGITDRGELSVRYENGKRENLSSGEVSIREIKK